METKPVIAGLFADTPQGPRLLGSRCASCAAPYFPKSAVCHNPKCGESKIQDAAFGPRGRLWSLAIQSYAPPPPVKFDEPFKPYAMGVVDLDDGLRVLGRISTDDLRSLRPDMPVELVLEPLYHEADGTEVITWKFRPV
ncbi:MAG: OB-fold domain-containing protein [Deltaproteobacteria bacterium]|nr:OB-fold domain-containing protein [Deltaproteobacteria bacterium]